MRSHAAEAPGFTLIELLVVIVILGLLAGIAGVTYFSRIEGARVQKVEADFATLATALSLYRLDAGTLPTTAQGLQALVEKPSAAPLAPNWKTGGYVERLPKDPWGNPYQYLNPGLHGEIDVFSYGADRAPGGDGNDADIGSWNL